MHDAFNITARFQSALESLVPTIEGFGLWVAGVGLLMMLGGLVFGTRQRFMAELTFRGVGLLCLGMVMMAMSAVF